MGWGKIVLVFQAVITLILGILFFMSTFSSADLTIDVNSSDTSSFTEFQQKFETASYVLLTIAFIELILISRLV